MSLLITADDLRIAMSERRPLAVLDVRWRLDRPDGRPAYLEGHVPSAVYVSLDAELARPGAATDGRHPLPRIEDLELSARRWGVNQGDTVVVYDDLGNLSAARAWWLLRYAGIADVVLLDGGLQSWERSGFEVESGEVVRPEGNVTISAGHLPILAFEEVAEFATKGVLLDARAPERFRGDVEPVDPRAGHIPGARNSPTTENLDAEGRFLSPSQLRERFESLGLDAVTPVATYCGSGVTAAHNVVALALAGFDAALYPGSWSQWSNYAGLPVAVGEAEEVS